MVFAVVGYPVISYLVLLMASCQLCVVSIELSIWNQIKQPLNQTNPQSYILLLF
jgi:hypothetical protein